MKTKHLILSFILLLTVSCANPLSTNITPLITRANIDDSNEILLTDSTILEYANDLSMAYKSHSIAATTIRRGSRSLLAIIETISFGTASRILSGLTLGISSQQSVWDEKTRSITFMQGAAFIDKAISEYLESLSKETPLKDGMIIITGSNVSISGARLYKRISSIESVVNLMLTGLVPNLEDLNIAKGVGTLQNERK